MLTHDILEAAYREPPITPKTAVVIHKVSTKKINNAFDMSIKIISEKGLFDNTRTIENYKKLIDLFFKQKKSLKDSANMIGIKYNSARSMRENIVNAFKTPDIYEYLFGKGV